MRRSHLVPKFLLRNFADANEKLVMVPRRPPHDSRPIAVNNACVERDFYTIAAEALEESHQADHDPDLAEKALSNLEDAAAKIIRAMLAGEFPLSTEQRCQLSAFIALQMTRGRRFRRDMTEFGTIVMRQELEMLPLDRFRDWLRQHGEPHDDRAVAAFRERALGTNGPRLMMTQPHAVQQSLRVAVEDLGPYLFSRTWRLLQFSDDLLLISDNPVGLWSMVPASPEIPSGQDFSVGVDNARMICLPLNRRTALAMIPGRGKDCAAPSGAERARQINMAAIQDAEQWIYHHPSDHPLDGVAIPQPSIFVEETFAIRDEANGVRRELCRVVKRSPPAPAG